MNETNISLSFSVTQPYTTDDGMDEILGKLMELGEILKVITPLIFILLFLVGTVGNILVAYVTLSPASNRFTTRPIHSVLVLNLAAADLLYLLCSLPYQAITFSVPGWIYGATMCPLLNFLNVWAMGVGIFTMCSLALMRFIGLVLPFRFRNSFLNSSSGRTRMAMAFALWCLGAVLALPNLLYFQMVGDFQKQCTWLGQKSHNVYWIILVTCTYVIPFFLVATLYIVIAVQVICFMKKKDMRSSQARPDQGGYRKMTTIVVSLIAAFLMSWFPYHLYVLIQVSGKYNENQFAIPKSILQFLAYCFSYTHACVNPIIYTFAAPEFRQSLYASIRRRSLHMTGPCSWKRSSPRVSSPQDLPETRLTYINSDQSLKRITSVHVEMSTLPQSPPPRKT